MIANKGSKFIFKGARKGLVTQASLVDFRVSTVILDLVFGVLSKGAKHGSRQKDPQVAAWDCRSNILTGDSIGNFINASPD